MHTEPTKNVPMVRKLFPAYRKRNVNVRATTKVTFFDLNWSGGSRSEYHAIDLSNGAARTMSNWNQLAPWANPYEGSSVELVPGFAVVKTGYFCGKESTLTIYVHPDNMPKLLAMQN